MAELSLLALMLVIQRIRLIVSFDHRFTVLIFVVKVIVIIEKMIDLGVDCKLIVMLQCMSQRFAAILYQLV